ncbi:MAG: hypothetical protein M3276_04820, partial [Actinomycetota bacterium]|nr:hypothetical protein [Actinomycetota bacterium]
TLLFVVLCAAALTSSRLSLGAAAVVGSFVAHTHVGTAPFVAALLAVTAVVRWRWATRRSPREPAAPVRGKLAALALVALLVAVWSPPLVEQLTAPSGNLSELARFALARQPGHPLGEAAAGWTAAITVVPFGLASTHELPAGTSVPRLLGVAAWLAAAVACIAVGRVRGNRFAVALGGSSVLGAAVCGVLVTRVAGPLLGYVLYWMAAVPLAAWVGVVAMLAEPGQPGRVSRAAVRGVPLLAVAGLTVALTASAARVEPVSELSDERVATVVDLVDRRVDLSDGGQVVVGIATHGHGIWILMAGVVNELDRRGADVSVSRWLDRYSERFRPSGGEELEVLLGRVGAVDPDLTVGARWVGRAGNTEVFFR